MKDILKSLSEFIEQNLRIQTIQLAEATMASPAAGAANRGPLSPSGSQDTASPATLFVKSSAQISQLNTQIADLQLQVGRLTEYQKIVGDRDHALLNELQLAIQKRNAKISQEEGLQRDPKVRVFYRHIQRKLTELFLAFMALDSGLIPRQADTTDKIAYGISVLGEMIPLPFFGMVASVFSKGVQMYHEKKVGDSVTSALDAITDLSDVERIAGGVARKLSLRYREPLLFLQDENAAQTLAEYTFSIMMRHLFSGNLSKERTLNDELVYVVGLPKKDDWFDSVTDKAGQLADKLRKLMGIIQTLSVTMANGKAFHPNDVLTRCGLMTLEDTPQYFGGVATDVENLGFRTGSASRAKALNMTLLGTERPVTACPQQPLLSKDIPLETDDHAQEIYEVALGSVDLEKVELRTKVDALEKKVGKLEGQTTAQDLAIKELKTQQERAARAPTPTSFGVAVAQHGVFKDSSHQNETEPLVKKPPESHRGCCCVM